MTVRRGGPWSLLSPPHEDTERRSPSHKRLHREPALTGTLTSDLPACRAVRKNVTPCVTFRRSNAHLQRGGPDAGNVLLDADTAGSGTSGDVASGNQLGTFCGARVPRAPSARARGGCAQPARRAPGSVAPACGRTQLPFSVFAGVNLPDKFSSSGPAGDTLWKNRGRCVGERGPVKTT